MCQRVTQSPPNDLSGLHANVFSAQCTKPRLRQGPAAPRHRETHESLKRVQLITACVSLHDSPSRPHKREWSFQRWQPWGGAARGRVSTGTQATVCSVESNLSWRCTHSVSGFRVVVRLFRRKRKRITCCSCRRGVGVRRLLVLESVIHRPESWARHNSSCSLLRVTRCSVVSIADGTRNSITTLPNPFAERAVPVAYTAHRIRGGLRARVLLRIKK